MAMFPLSQEPTCFMQHYGLMTTWVRVVVRDKMGSPEPDLNISADLPNGISPFDLADKNNEEFKVMWEQMKCPRTAMNCYGCTTSWGTYHSPKLGSWPLWDC